jgi:hypothetical protein
MGLTTEDKRKLTESRYYRPEVGETATVEFRNWRYAEIPYNNDQSGDKRPTLIMDVTSVNGRPQNPPKIWNSQGRNTNAVLINSIDVAEREGREFLRLTLQRIDKRTYNILDPAIIDGAMRGLSYAQK